MAAHHCRATKHVNSIAALKDTHRHVLRHLCASNLTKDDQDSVVPDSQVTSRINYVNFIIIGSRPTILPDFAGCCRDRNVAEKCVSLCSHNVTAQDVVTQGPQCIEHLQHWIACGVGEE